ncbi:cadherin-like beta sandwich domain-containing protein [Zongyangia hominis]|uniref:Cadherin-like beta sandwich domain-containing protein n=1 Tax=Zongyangia hominis TaxID=2763677 RepID=A0A926IAQ8_9FIRM|nr:cadherin-like beta sandwich domain-containing protein [Zongyangia hominis]MBC8569357.1 cadherin-like beta sandwich domain-containing protein [Zongyangia hominis]
MRRKLLSLTLAIAICLTSLIPGVTAFAADGPEQFRGTQFITNLTGWNGFSGNWAIGSDGVRGSNGSMNDGFYLSDVKVEAGDAFTYEASFTVNEGKAGGIVFGVADTGNPSADWFCANIDKSRSNGQGDSRIFHVLQGQPLAFDKGRNLTAEELKANDFTLKVVYDGAGHISSYLNGNVVVDNEDVTFDGGSFGLLTFQSDVTFHNAMLTVNGVTQGFTTNLPGMTGKNGSWSLVDSGFQGNNMDVGDGFAMSGAYVSAEQAFTYEASFSIVEGTAGGIVFGVADPNNPSADWYCANVDKSGNRGGKKDSRIFHVKNGLQSEKGRDLTTDELATDDYTIKVVYDGEGHFSSYLNDVAVMENEPISFNGGYFGLLTYKSKVDFHSALLSTSAEEKVFHTNATGWHGVVGTWEKASPGYRGANETIGDAFALSDIYLPSGSSFTYEADMTINVGPAGGLVFGIANPSSPSDRWYCLNVNKTDKNTRFFRVNGVGKEESRALTETEQASNQFHLKVELAADGTLTCTTNNEVVTSQKVEGFAGGYMGLLTWNSDVTFDNVNLTYQLPESQYVEPGNLIVPEGSKASGNAADGYLLEGAGLGNNFAILDNLVGPFSFEANMEFTSNSSAAGLMFGIGDKNNLGRKFCALHINNNEKTARVFYEYEYFNPPAGRDKFDYKVSLPDSVMNQKIIPIKITVGQDKMVKVYIGNMYIPVINKKFEAYAGGYLGFMTNNTSAKFTDVKIYSGEPEDPLSTYELTDLELGELHGEHVTGNAADGYVMEKGGSYNNFAVFDGYTTAMEYKATMEILDGDTAAGLMFGVGDTQASGNDWSAIHIQPSRGNTMRVFCEKNWDKKDGLNEQVNLPAGTSDKPMNFKVTIDLNNVLKVYVNDMDNPLVNTTLSGYTGGHVGFMTFNTGAKFTNLSLKGIVFPQLQGLELIGANLNESFDPSCYDYTSDVPVDTASVKVKASFDGITATLNGKKLTSGVESDVIPLGTGKNIINLVLTSADGVLSRAVKIAVNKPYNLGDAYNETFRPQFHFSQMQYWCNDPNGMVYNAETGEYHLYYQYNPAVLYHDGQSHWGHAVSKDMVHWTELPIALYPDDIGIMASGSGVIDRNNTSGFFDDSTPPESRMVAVFTYFANGPHPGEGGGQRQALAYSKDNGLTWTKYEGNSVIPNEGNKYGGDFRDPKVMWMEDTQEWLMVVAGGRARIFTSPDLKTWTHNSDIDYNDGSGIWSECPDLYPLKVEGTDQVKWVYSGCGVFYVIGDLVKEGGKYVFKADTNRLSFYEGGFGGGSGGDMYATQSFSNTPDGRTVLISWMPESNADALKAYDKNWNGNQSMPLEAKLYNVGGQIKLATYPIEEMKSLRSPDPLYTVENISVTPDSENILKDVNGTLYDIEAEFTLGGATEFGFNLRTAGDQKTVVKYDVTNQKLIVDKNNSGVLSTGVKSLSLAPNGDKLKLRILVDTSIIDAFGNDGITSVNTFYYPNSANTGMEFFTTGGNVKVDSMNIYAMNSAWSETTPVPVVPLLTSVDFSKGELSPAFDPTVNEYTMTVANDVESIDVTSVFAWATTVSGTVNGDPVAIGEAKTVPLNVGENTITIHLKDRVSENIYTIKVTREPAIQTPVLEGLALSDGTLTPAFASNVTAYTASVDNGVESVKVKATFADGTTVKIGDKTLTSGQDSDAIALNVGENTITLSLTGADGGVNTYAIKVTRAEKGEPPIVTPVLDGLELSQGTLKPAFAADVNNYTASVAYAVNTIKVKAAFAEGITVKIGDMQLTSGQFSEAIPLNVGENTITLSLTGADGGVNTYTIKVTRAEKSGGGTVKPSIPGGSNSDWKWPGSSSSANGGKDNPKAGDASQLPVALAILAAAAGTAVWASRKKKK